MVIFHSYVSHYQRVTTKTRTALSPAWRHPPWSHVEPRFQVVSSDRIIAVDGFEGSGAALMDKAPDQTRRLRRLRRLWKNDPF